MKKLIGLVLISVLVTAAFWHRREKHAPIIPAVAASSAPQTAPELIPPRQNLVAPAAPAPSPAVTFSREVLEEEALAVNHIDPNPSATEQRLKAMAAKLTESDRKLLADTALNLSGDRNQRRVALYLLTNCPNTSSEMFLSIANLTSTLPKEKPAAHSGEEHELLLNQTLAVTALDSLQIRALKQDPALRAQIARVGDATSDRTIKYLVAQTVRALATGKKYRLDIL